MHSLRVLYGSAAVRHMSFVALMNLVMGPLLC